MKKLFALIAVLSLLFITTSTNVVAQDETAPATSTEEVQQAQPEAQPVAVDQEEIAAAQAESGQSFHSALKQKFIEGGPGFMTSILVVLILGLAISKNLIELLGGNLNVESDAGKGSIFYFHIPIN